jgi:flagellar biogenesis protein FliO
MSTGSRARIRAGLLLTVFLTCAASFAQTNAIPQPLPLPSAGPSIIRVFSAFALVIALFFGGVWAWRNWQRFLPRTGRPAPLLDICEARSLGNRQTIFVVRYDRQRFLIAAGPSGVSLLSPLDEGSEFEVPSSIAPFPPGRPPEGHP